MRSSLPRSGVTIWRHLPSLPTTIFDLAVVMSQLPALKAATNESTNERIRSLGAATLPAVSELGGGELRALVDRDVALQKPADGAVAGGALEAEDPRGRGRAVGRGRRGPAGSPRADLLHGPRLFAARMPLRSAPSISPA